MLGGGNKAGGGGLGSGLLGAPNTQQAMTQQPSEMTGLGKPGRFNPRWTTQTKFGDPKWMSKMPENGMTAQAWQMKSQMPMSTNTQQAMAQQPGEMAGAAPRDRSYNPLTGAGMTYAQRAERAYGPGGGRYGLTGQVPTADLANHQSYSHDYLGWMRGGAAPTDPWVSRSALTGQPYGGGAAGGPSGMPSVPAPPSAGGAFGGGGYSQSSAPPVSYGNQPAAPYDPTNDMIVRRQTLARMGRV